MSGSYYRMHDVVFVYDDDDNDDNDDDDNDDDNDDNMNITRLQESELYPAQVRNTYLPGSSRP